ncbi:MAG: hypothetical protein LBS43_10740 [Prevotellaceae bacterium]|jgi:hypothetical protein|nr:hypothetical protein [Prevotellaceae bacterium]
MNRIRFYLSSLVSVVILGVGLSSCGGGGSTKSNSSSTNEQQAEKEEIPAKVKEIYDFINGESFKATYAEQGAGQYGPTIYTSTLTLIFKPIKSTDFVGAGKVTMKITRETNSLAGGRSNSDSNELGYLITRYGNIIVGNMNLTKERSRLVSDQDNGQGGYITFYKQY